jgi:hypothetical protein
MGGVQILAWRVAETFAPVNSVAVLVEASRGATPSETTPVVLADTGVENVNAQVDDLITTGVLRSGLGLQGAEVLELHDQRRLSCSRPCRLNDENSRGKVLNVRADSLARRQQSGISTIFGSSSQPRQDLFGGIDQGILQTLFSSSASFKHHDGVVREYPNHAVVTVADFVIGPLAQAGDRGSSCGFWRVSSKDDAV